MEQQTQGKVIRLNGQALLGEVDSAFDLPEQEREARLCELEMDAAQAGPGCLSALRKKIKLLRKEMRGDARRPELPLRVNADGAVLTTIGNFRVILNRDERFARLRYNGLTCAPEVTEDLRTRLWSDADDSAAMDYIEARYHIHSEAKYHHALNELLTERSYHPIRDRISGIHWDGEPRMEQLLIRWMKCPDTPYVREVSRLIFAGGIARLYNPGCKFDEMPVLIGPHQGEGKSTLARWLAMEDDWYSEVCDFDGAKGIEALQGAWICEVSELLALTRTREVEACKAYISRLSDKYRAPYARRVQILPRQCIFIGTTNRQQFLSDKTGNRRYYPVTVHSRAADLYAHEAECRAYIAQCWAEAKHLYDAKSLPARADPKLEDEIRAEQLGASEDDWRDGMIAGYLNSRPIGAKVCVLELWQEALKMHEARMDKADASAIRLIMQAAPGWERGKEPARMPGYGVQRYWQRM